MRSVQAMGVIIIVLLLLLSTFKSILSYPLSVLLYVSSYTLLFWLIVTTMVITTYLCDTFWWCIFSHTLLFSPTNCYHHLHSTLTIIFPMNYYHLLHIACRCISRGQTHPISSIFKIVLIHGFLCLVLHSTPSLPPPHPRTPNPILSFKPAWIYGFTGRFDGRVFYVSYYFLKVL